MVIDDKVIDFQLSDRIEQEESETCNHSAGPCEIVFGMRWKLGLCVHINESSLQRRELGANLQIGERMSRVSDHVCKRDIRVYTERKWGPNGCTCIRERE
jgi:hypothetical protein